ncbi:MAG: orotidine-5'-phosphate decarboxylase [Planctomycetota bacterium]
MTAAAIVQPRFSDRLAERIAHVGAPLCVGLDPVLERLPAEIETADPSAAFEAFSARLIDAVGTTAAAIKPQSACFERLGWRGVRALERTIGRARDAGLVVVLDVKRGDIGLSAAHYAAAARDAGADAVTVSPYMGPSSIEPFLDAGLGVFALVRTSNPDSDAVQSVATSDGSSVAERVARMVAEIGASCTGARGLSDLGAVVGATKAQDGPALRAAMPDQVFLVPGIGAQGGKVEDLRPLVRAGATGANESGLLVTASRSVIYPDVEAGEHWTDAARRSAETLATRLRVLL